MTQNSIENKKFVYLDNAATTPMYPEVVDAMLPFFTENYGNPSSVYGFGGIASKAVGAARERIAAGIGAKKEEIYFTSGGTEADNWALKSIAETFSGKGKHIITSGIEHHAVLNTCELLEKQGYEITCLNVNSEGVINLEELENAIRPDTILISVMAANNETGTIEPLSEIGRIARSHDVLFHTDAVQAFGHIPINVDDMNIDLLSASAHKLNGPKGVGLLYIRRGIKLAPFIHGGAQERGLRAGTHNVPGIVGFGKAAELAFERLSDNAEKETALREYLIKRVLSEIPHSYLNGHRTERLPNNANFSFYGVEGETLLMLLDQSGICASSGSACTSGALDPSHVLIAIGRSPKLARGSLRLTLSEKTTKEEIDYTVDTLKSVIERLREFSLDYSDLEEKQH